MKVSCIAWAPFSDRLDELASEIGGKRKNINLGYLPKYAAPLKYIAYFFMTLVYLLRERPSVVYAQNPPIFCPISCLPYCKLAGARLVVDHHNLWYVKSFEGSALAPLVKALEAALARSADANTVPHSVWRDDLVTLGGRRVLTVHDYVEKNPYPRSEQVRRSLCEGGLVGIASGHQGLPLERIEAEAQAAEMVQGVMLAITGPPARLGPRISALGPMKNVKFLGYLPKAEYEALKASCDFALNITDERHTVNHVLFEYAAASLPTVCSRKPEIEAVFGDCLVYVDSSDPVAVSARLAWLTSDPARVAEYRSRMSARFQQLTADRDSELRALSSLISSGPRTISK